MLQSAADFIAHLRELLGAEPLAWMPRVMLAFMLAWRPWTTHAPLGSAAALLGMASVATAVSGLLLPALSASGVFWFVLAAFHFAWISRAYHQADNHFYLIGYWCVAIGVALSVGGSEGSALLSRNAFALVGLCFAFAVFAKIVNPRYRDSSMFCNLLLLDPRFMAIAAIAGGVAPAEIERHRDAVHQVRHALSERVSVPCSRRLQLTAFVLTWWTVGIEMLIAVLFFWPQANDGWRVAIFAAFALPTYLLVAVPAFGQILALIVAAATPNPETRAYLLLAALAMFILTIVPDYVMRLAMGRHKHTLEHRVAPAASLSSLKPQTTEPTS